MAKTALFPEFDSMLEKVSTFFFNLGFKRIHGKIWALLAASDQPQDAADLIRRLEISKALVSISVRELLEIKAVTDVGRSARGTRLYRANTNLAEVALHVLKSRELPLLLDIQMSVERLKELESEKIGAHGVSLETLSRVSETFQRSGEALTTLISTLQVSQREALGDSAPAYRHAKPEFEPS